MKNTILLIAILTTGVFSAPFDTTWEGIIKSVKIVNYSSSDVSVSLKRSDGSTIYLVMTTGEFQPVEKFNRAYSLLLTAMTTGLSVTFTGTGNVIQGIEAKTL